MWKNSLVIFKYIVPSDNHQCNILGIKCIQLLFNLHQVILEEYLNYKISIFPES